MIEDILTAANLDKFGDDSRWVQVSLDEVVDCSELIHCALKTQWQKSSVGADEENPRHSGETIHAVQGIACYIRVANARHGG